MRSGEFRIVLRRNPTVGDALTHVRINSSLAVFPITRARAAEIYAEAAAAFARDPAVALAGDPLRGFGFTQLDEDGLQLGRTRVEPLPMSAEVPAFP